MSDYFLEMRGVGFGYPDSPAVVSDVDWTLRRGEFHCLLGSSGCGKSTILKLAAGLLLPDSGTVMLEGEAVREPGHLTGFVFQSPTLLEWLSVLDNVLLPVSLRGKPTAGDTAYALALLDELGLAGMQSRQPSQLSGGQQSRVAIARALITQPRLLLMDEPFAALDALTRETLQDSLLDVCSSHGTSVVFVTHDISEAVYLADEVAVMDSGRIIHEHSVPLGRPRAPGARHSVDFIEHCAALRRVMDETRKNALAQEDRV